MSDYAAMDIVVVVVMVDCWLNVLKITSGLVYYSILTCFYSHPLKDLTCIHLSLVMELPEFRGPTSFLLPIERPYQVNDIY